MGRICYFRNDESSAESQLIALGCDCKDPNCAGGYIRGDGLKVEQKKSNKDVVIDIKDHDKLCRICHESSRSSEIIELGCDCRGENGLAHYDCAATWFFLYKQSEICEICRKTAKHVNNRIVCNDPSISPNRFLNVYVVLSALASLLATANYIFEEILK